MANRSPLEHYHDAMNDAFDRALAEIKRAAEDLATVPAVPVADEDEAGIVARKPRPKRERMADYEQIRQNPQAFQTVLAEQTQNLRPGMLPRKFVEELFKAESERRKEGPDADREGEL